MPSTHAPAPDGRTHSHGPSIPRQGTHEPARPSALGVPAAPGAQLLHREDLDPRAQECHPCYVERLEARLGCAGDLRLTRCWQHLRAPGAVALERRLQEAGVGCDCQVVLRVYEPAPRALLARAAGAGTPACPGVRRGSTQPCTAWRRRAAWAG